MKQLIKLALGISLSALVLAACKTPVDLDAEPTEVAWPRAVELVNSGDVEMAFQTHALLVVLEMKNGSSYQTIEPNIDEIFRLIDQCGRKCEDIAIATE